VRGPFFLQATKTESKERQAERSLVVGPAHRILFVWVCPEYVQQGRQDFVHSLDVLDARVELGEDEERAPECALHTELFRERLASSGINHKLMACYMRST
jgi:hypothetical protein